MLDMYPTGTATLQPSPNIGAFAAATAAAALRRRRVCLTHAEDRLLLLRQGCCCRVTWKQVVPTRAATLLAPLCGIEWSVNEPRSVCGATNGGGAQDPLPSALSLNTQGITGHP